MDKTEIKEDLEKARDEAEKNPAVENKTENEKRAAAAEAEESEVVAKLKEELEAAKEKYIRLYSEFENFRKRTAKEKHGLIQSANEQLLKNLLPVVDDFERAEDSFPDKNDKDLAGFFLIHSKFKKILDLYGVRTMEAEQGTDFNADLHEAISQLQAPAELKGKIIEVVEKGYILNDKVIRYAKVVVGN